MNFNCTINIARGKFTYNGVKDFGAVMLVNVRDQLINFYFKVVDWVAVDFGKFISIVEDGFEFVGVVGSVHDYKNVGSVSVADYYIMMVFEGFSGINQVFSEY